jgi:threonine synthase
VKFVSTRGDGPVSLDEALVKGIANDGGLFLPASVPAFDESDFENASDIADVARVLLAPFFAESGLRDDLESILAETFSFAIPVRGLPNGKSSILELFHGPTAAFKDIGAGFLAACLTRLAGDEASPLTILVATSGDTGGAVAAAFDERPGMRVVILYPDGRVSDRQAQQLSCWSDNVLTLRVHGSFDDCQALAKAALADSDLSSRYRFSSANSINIGRLLPQAIYYADASLRHFRTTGEKPGFVIPTGNLGNAFACILARELGLPIGPIMLATNSNRSIPDYFESLRWSPRPSVKTLASAMDVGDPSNMERLRGLIGEADVLRERLRVTSVDDEQIEAEIRQSFADYGFAICPHTATASYAWRHMDRSERDGTHWIIVATAHPAKFETIVEPLINSGIALPDELAAILSRPSSVTDIEPTLVALVDAMRGNFAS